MSITDSVVIRRMKNLKLKIKKALALLLIFQLLTFNFAFFASPVYAASSPWSQTDWSGGSGQTSWTDTTKFDSSSTIDTSTTSGEASLSVAEKLSNTGFASDNSSWSVAAVPPSGWVEVPGNSTYSTTNFLAMKYEAKCAATSDLTTGLTSQTTGYNTWPDNTAACTSANSRAVVSVASGYPIANISHTDALTRCSTVSLNGNATHLMRNDEWMTVARNAEAQADNWSLGSVGSGYLFAGHNDNSPVLARVASTTDTGNNACAYTNTAGTTEAPSSCPTNTSSGQSATAGNQKRVFTLSNGAYIWDIAGNVWEHAQRSTSNSGDDTTNMTTLPACSDNAASWGWCQYGSSTTPYVSSWPSAVPSTNGSSNTAYNSAQGVGQVYTYKNGTGQSTSVFIRGGNWGNASGAGAFTLYLYWAASSTNYNVGLRCASDPVAISQSFSSTSGRSSAGGNTITIGSVSDGKIYQSVNVGDTSTYNISAYVYDNTTGNVGGAVDTNVAQLYYGGNTISSAAWTAVSGETGWYKLTGTVTGVASGVDSGVLVKSGKTVIVDDVSLSKEYNSSGTLTSSIFDSEFTIGAAWGILTYTSSGSTVAVKARTSNSSSMTGATAFSSCSAITSGSDISSNSCVTDGHRYIQYQLALSTADTSSTPTFSDVSIAFATYDADAPSISLTALATDPNSDNTPTLSGTATESVGTVSNVQYQMDGTSGSWTACTASDGSFNSASEAFSCTASTLTDGSHTMYVRATDSNGNTTSSGYASDTFTIDSTNPVSIDLDSPGDNSYTNSERPTFKWKATTDATAGLSKYVLEIDNPSIGSGQPSGDFTIDSIPTSRTTDYETNKYIIHYENFSDSDSTNNYISVYTKSHSDWGTSENDGKLREGKVSWKVKARDNAGNETSSSRTLYVDFTSPSLSSLAVSDSLGEKNSYHITTNQTPSVTGTITDTYYPDKVEIAIYKENYFLGTLTSTGLIITRTQSLSNTSSTNLSFSVPASQALDYGSYHIDVTGSDKAGNKSSTSTLNLKIMTLRQAQELLQGKVDKEVKKTIQEKSQISLPELEKKAILRREKEASEFRKLTRGFSNQINSAARTTSVIASEAWQSFGNLYKSSTAWIPALASSASSVIANTSEAISSSVKIAASSIGNGLPAMTNNIGKTYNNLALKAPGIIKNSMLAVENGVNTVGSTISRTNQLALNVLNKSQENLEDNMRKSSKETGDTIKTLADNSSRFARTIISYPLSAVRSLNDNLAKSQESIQKQIAQTHQNTSDNIKDKSNRISKGISLAFRSLQKPVQDSANLLDRAKVWILTFESIVLDSNPTAISDVTIDELGKDYAVVSWKTNHYAWGKVNYGKDLTYGEEALLTKREKVHTARLTGLKPGEKYYFEVMSQNKNYVYDAYYSFETQK